MKPVKVGAYSGYKADQEPKTFEVEGRRIKVKEVLASYRRWDLNDKRYYTVYKVRCDDGRVYELLLDKGKWYLIF